MHPIAVTTRSESDKIVREHVAQRMPSDSIGPQRTHLDLKEETLDAVALIIDRDSKVLAQVFVRSRSKIESDDPPSIKWCR